jgi:hypothetical protein
MVVLTGTTTIALGPTVVLNTIDTAGTIWRIDQFGFTGWGSPAPTLNPIPRTRGRGATAGDSFDSARVMAINGTIAALTPAALNAAIDSLKAAVTRAEFLMTVTESGRARWCRPRRSGETLTPKITNLIASYSIQVESLDPRQFDAPLTALTGLGVSGGGLIIPEIVPAVISGGGTNGTVSLINTGVEQGPVIARIDGPCAPFSILHQSAVDTSTFASSLTLNAGEFVTIDMEGKKMLANGTASRSLFITSRAWSGFDPGGNTWTFTAAAYNPASLLTITATSAN